MFQPPILLASRGAEVDEAIIVRLQRREPQARAELCDRYGRIAYSLILHVVRDTRIAEDLVQETFLCVWNRLQTLDAQKGAVGPWLLAVAHNRAIDYLRSAGGRERNAVEFEETDHPSLYTDIERSILASDKARVVKAAIESFRRTSARSSNSPTSRYLADRNGRSHRAAARHRQDLGPCRPQRFAR
jgi:RNA polymerase sigma-70 factor (ECF subfamily)